MVSVIVVLADVVSLSRSPIDIDPLSVFLAAATFASRRIAKTDRTSVGSFMMTVGGVVDDGVCWLVGVVGWLFD